MILYRPFEGLRPLLHAQKTLRTIFMLFDGTLKVYRLLGGLVGSCFDFVLTITACIGFDNLFVHLYSPQRCTDSHEVLTSLL